MATEQKQWWALRGAERERAKAEDEARLTKLNEARRLAAEADELKPVKRTAETPKEVVELRSASGRRAYRHGDTIHAFHDEATRRLAYVACLADVPRLPRNIQVVVPDDVSFLRLRGPKSGHEELLFTPRAASYLVAMRAVLWAERRHTHHNPPATKPGNTRKQTE